MTDPSSTERRVSEAMHRLADGHRPDVDAHWPPSHPNARPTASGSAPKGRWMLMAASVVAVVALAAMALVQFGGDDATTDPDRDLPGAVDPVDELADGLDDTTAPTEPVESVPTEQLSGERFSVSESEQGTDTLAPWGDGFLAWSVDDPTEEGDTPTIRARFSIDGERWEPIEMTMPPGMTSFGRIASLGDRLATASFVYPADGSEVARIASTTDLVTWSVQDAELPDLPDVGEFGGSFSSMGSFAANNAGWVFEVRDIHGEDVAIAMLGNIDGSYRIRSDGTGFTVAVDGPDGSPPTPDTTSTYTWAEVGITPEQVPYMTGDIPAARTLTATWDGTPVVSDTTVPWGPTLASPAGFVRWVDHTWFSPDGITWSSGPLPDPTGQVQTAFAVDGGFVATVVGQDGSHDVYRLDERGGDARPIDLDGMPEQFFTEFSGVSIPSLQNAEGGATLLDAAGPGGAPPPLVIDLDGYRYVERSRNISVIDLATGDTVLTRRALDGPPAADTWFGFTEDGITVTDPATETVLMQIPMDIYQAALAAQNETTPTADPAAEYVEDLRVLASRDGEQFLLEPLRSSTPIDDPTERTVDAATNGDTLLVRFGDEWIRWELPS